MKYLKTYENINNFKKYIISEWDEGEYYLDEIIKIEDHTIEIRSLFYYLNDEIVPEEEITYHIVYDDILNAMLFTSDSLDETKKKFVEITDRYKESKKFGL